MNWLLLGSPGLCGTKKVGVVTGGLGQRGLTHSTEAPWVT